MPETALRLVDKDVMDKNKALVAAVGQIERAFGKGSIMRLGQRETAVEIDSVSSGSIGLDIALGIGGLPRGRVVEIYGPRKLGQDDACAPRGGRGPEDGRHLRLHRRRARPGSVLCAQAGRQSGRASDLAARRGRAGPRDRRHPGALGRRRSFGDRQRRCLGAARRARGRDGRHPRRSSRPGS